MFGKLKSFESANQYNLSSYKTDTEAGQLTGTFSCFVVFYFASFVLVYHHPRSPGMLLSLKEIIIFGSVPHMLTLLSVTTISLTLVSNIFD